jgi:5,10-methenyltetrahydrofolate synthetase
MDKKELRRSIRERKRAMTEEEIVSRSEKLAELFYASEAYKNAKTIYGYLPYNQEVRTVPMLERALQDGKRVAVPKCYGDEMKFIFMDDLTKVEKGTTITVVYYCTHGQCYNQLTGPVSKIDSFWYSLQVGQVCIDFEDIYEVLV